MELNLKDIERLLDWYGYLRGYGLDSVSDHPLYERLEAAKLGLYEEQRREC